MIDYGAEWLSFLAFVGKLAGWLAIGLVIVGWFALYGNSETD